MPNQPLQKISILTLFIYKDVPIKELGKLYDVLCPLEVNVGSRIGYMLLAENTFKNKKDIENVKRMS